MSPALAGGFSTTVPPGKPPDLLIEVYFNYWHQFNETIFECLVYASNCARPSDSHLQGAHGHVNQPFPCSEVSVMTEVVVSVQWIQ